MWKNSSSELEEEWKLQWLLKGFEGHQDPNNELDTQSKGMVECNAPLVPSGSNSYVTEGSGKSLENEVYRWEKRESYDLGMESSLIRILQCQRKYR